jgi:hypothetical protein
MPLDAGQEETGSRFPMAACPFRPDCGLDPTVRFHAMLPESGPAGHHPKQTDARRMRWSASWRLDDFWTTLQNLCAGVPVSEEHPSGAGHQLEQLAEHRPDECLQRQAPGPEQTNCLRHHVSLCHKCGSGSRVSGRSGDAGMARRGRQPHTGLGAVRFGATFPSGMCSSKIAWSATRPRPPE